MDMLVVTYVPEENAEQFRDALLKYHFNRMGKYTNCLSYSNSTGCFTADEDAKPFVGNAGELNLVKEVRFEFKCNFSRQPNLIKYLKEIHPYEEPTIYCIPLLG